MAAAAALPIRAFRASAESAARSFFELVFPARCVICGILLDAAPEMQVCARCPSLMRRVADPKCVRCGLPFPDSPSDGHHCMDCLTQPPQFDGAQSVFVYEEPVQSAILRFKFHGQGGLRHFFAESLASCLDVSLTRGRTDVLVPVPLHWMKLAGRGYNQTALLADELSLRTGISADRHGLRKVKRTPAQSRLPREKRRQSLRGAFRADRLRFDGKSVLLVDDVMTTGATLSECARALKAAGARQVEAVTVARAV